MKKSLLLTTIGLCLLCAWSSAQNVFNPNDLNRRWLNAGGFNNDSTLLTANPDPNISGLQKWVSVKTNGVDSTAWGKDYKAYFINYFGTKLAFRLKFPFSISNPDSAAKVYPAMLFFHGAGEPGCPSNGGVYNNEKQMVHGGRTFRDRVANNQFDGYLIYPQINGVDCWSSWGVPGFAPNYNAIIAIIDSLFKYARLDVDRVMVDGLSDGGGASWSFTAVFPQRVAKAAPSSAVTGFTNFPDFIHVPIWFATGGRDTSPSLGSANSQYTVLKNLGANIRWTLYDNLGHGIWNNHWNYPVHSPSTTPYHDFPISTTGYQNFVQFMNDMHKANPLVYFQRYEFCADSAIDARIGITGGFYAYEWQRNGVTIATSINGAHNIIDGSSIISFTGNEMVVRSLGTYRVRFMRSATAAWSAWSPKPATISEKALTTTPPITINGLHSKVLTAPDGSVSVPLQLPEGYFAYQWERVSDNVVVSTSNSFVAPVGQYHAKTIEQFGCGSTFSPVFTVVDANGSPKPDPAKNLSALTISTSAIQLDWNENPNAGENETGFEVYRTTTPGNAYQLITITAPNVVSYLDQGLTPNTNYYYIVRAVGNFGAAANSNEVLAKTQEDILPPTVPANLIFTCAGRNTVTLKWDAATDNVAVYNYDIYVNGVRSHSTSGTSFSVNELTPLQTYSFAVRARDAAGNASQPSNQLNVDTRAQGLCYLFYQGNWTTLPDFDELNPVQAGMSPNIDIAVRPSGVNDNFGFLWQGHINITETGVHTFRLCSDAGSKMYFNMPYNNSFTATINNDGLHSIATCRDAALNLTPGIYPLAFTFFEATGAQGITLSWDLPGGGTSFVSVPNAAFTENFIPAGTAPLAPSNASAVGAAYNKINLAWNDNSNNETGFEIVRSTTSTGTFVPIATVTGNSFSDSGLIAETRYFYKVRAVGNFGVSSFANDEVNWKLNGNFDDALGSATRSLAGGGGSANPAIVNTDMKEGTHSVSLDGVDDFINVSNSTGGGFPSNGGFSQRTVSLWIKTSVTTGKRMIFEFGGPDNGMALRFNGNAMEAGIASNSVRNTISLANFASNPLWNNSTDDWNHIAVVYNISSLKLYLNGSEVAANNALSFTSIAAGSTSSSVVGSTGTTNAFNDAAYVFYSGLMDDIHVYTGAATLPDITAMMNFSHGQSMDTTLSLPALPNAPSNLSAQVASMDNINLSWNDNSNDETSFEVWRSVANNGNFRLLKIIPGGAGGTKNYSDTALFANVTYYYKVRAVGSGGNTGYSNEVNATTQNTPPEISRIFDFTMRFGTSFTLPVNASDVDGDPITFSFDNLPYFVTQQPVSNGNVNLVIEPTIGDQGVYTIMAYAADGFNGFDTTYFIMVINDNSVPVMNAISNVTLDEGGKLVIPVSASDFEGNFNMVWFLDNKPSFASFVDSGNGKGSVNLAPGYSSSGIYSMQVYVDDGNGAWTSRSFNITVNEVDPNETINVNMKGFNPGGAELWNDVDATQPAPFNKAALINTIGDTTTVGLRALTTNYGVSASGTQTGNNSGVFPDIVLKDYLTWGFFTGGTADTVRLQAYGLDTARRYNFTFFGGTTENCCGINASSGTTYIIGNQTAFVPYYLNTSVTDTIFQIKPNDNGEINITMVGNAQTQEGGILNALVIDAAFDDGTAPSAPTGLTGQFLANTGVQLNWTDRSYNEFNYKVYRSPNAAGPYTLLTPFAAKDSTEYLDETTNQFTVYYYYVVGSNNWGNGASSDTISVLTGNNKPAINALNNMFVKSNATAQEDFNVSDDPADVLTVSILNKPSFLALTSLGGNNYRIVATPSTDNVGFHILDVQVADDKGGVMVKQLIVTVSDKNTRSIFVNLGANGATAPAPWNNFLHDGNPGQTITDLVDENNVTTPIGMSFINGWSGSLTTGHITGNNSGVVPDSVLRGAIFYELANNARQITVTGLNDAMRYNIVIISSRNDGREAVTRLSVNVGPQSDTINAKYNSRETGNLNGLTSVGGNITVSLTKLTTTASTFMYLNGIIIEEYNPATVPVMNPINLYAEPFDRNRIKLIWSDRTSNENAIDGFQLQRATDTLFTQNVTLINMAQNTTVYTDAGLTPNAKYWYRVRSKVGIDFSEWSNAVKTITPLSITFVNFNFAVANAAAPWNNWQSLPNLGAFMNNLKNHDNQGTGYSLEITKYFNGENNAGMTTGNNSGMEGLVPDNVLMAGFWMDNTQESQIKVSGLNHSKRYRFGYISSSNWIGGDLTSTFTINGRTVYINGWQNTSKIVYIGDVVPDINGEVMLDISTTEAAGNGYSSGLLIEAYDDVNGGTVLNSANYTQTNNRGSQENAALLRAGSQLNAEARIYPNPFTDFINLDFYNNFGNNRITAEIFDLSGKLIMKRNFGALSEGYNTIRLNAGEAKLVAGVYIVTLKMNGNTVLAAKLVKGK